jgi:hypothetical protein
MSAIPPGCAVSGEFDVADAANHLDGIASDFDEGR